MSKQVPNKEETSPPVGSDADRERVELTVREAFAAAGFPIPSGAVEVKGCDHTWVCFSNDAIFMWDPIFYPARGWDFGASVRLAYVKGWASQPNLIDAPACDVAEWLPKEVHARLTLQNDLGAQEAQEGLKLVFTPQGRSIAAPPQSSTPLTEDDSDEQRSETHTVSKTAGEEAHD